MTIEMNEDVRRYCHVIDNESYNAYIDEHNEELYMLIREKNEDKPVLSELTVFLRPDEIKIITKDDGILFDISEEDVNVTSICTGF